MPLFMVPHRAHMLWALPLLLCPSPLEGLAYLCVFQLNSCLSMHHPSVPCTFQVTAHLFKTQCLYIRMIFVCRDPADVSSESDSAMTSSTVSKLAEARRTHLPLGAMGLWWSTIPALASQGLGLAFPTTGLLGLLQLGGRKTTQGLRRSNSVQNFYKNFFFNWGELDVTKWTEL